MDFIIDAIVEWLKGLLVDGIMGNLDGLFDNVNQSVGEIATQVGTTPADWNAGVFSMIRQISETAILPIAGVILTFVMTYELIQMLIERNNLHEVDTWMFFKWVFKTFVAVMILTNTFNIVLAVFDVSQHVIQQSAGIIQNGTEITPDVLDSLRTELEAMELGPLFGLWLQSFLIQLMDSYMRIVNNLIQNVIAHSHADKIKIALSKKENNMELLLADNGVGIEKEDLKHIFERLYKCDKGRSEKGSGLGLSIVHQLVEKMGGSIAVESLPGKGTEFMLLFPLEI